MKLIIRRSILSLLFLLVGLSSLTLIPLKAAPMSEITVKSTENLVVTPGLPFTTTISLVGAVDVSSFQFKFFYDETKFHYQSFAKSNELASNIIFNPNTPGVINLNYSDISSTLQGNVNLFSITFVANENLSIGEHSLLWADINFAVVSTLSNTYVPGQYDHIHFNLPPIKTGTYGDVNGDGFVNVNDVLFVQLYLAGLRDLSPASLQLADVNNDSVVNVNDVLFMQLYLAGLRSYLGPDPNIPQPTYTVSFFDYQGNLIVRQTVDKGKAALPPSISEEFVEGDFLYTFLSWSENTSNVTSNLDVYPIYKISSISGVPLANGTFNFSNAPWTLRTDILATLEKWLLDQHVSIPFFNNDSYAVFSSRVAHWSNEYSSVFGFGNPYATLLQPDVVGGNTYTYRTATTNAPRYLNPIKTLLGAEKDVLDLVNGTLYRYVPNLATGNGHILVDALAEHTQMMNMYYGVHGEEIATKFKVTLHQGMKFYDALGNILPTSHVNNDISAADVIYTYLKLISMEAPNYGNFSFLSDVIGAWEYRNGYGTAADVMIQEIAGDPYSFTIEFHEPMTEFEFKSYFTQIELGIVYQPYFDQYVYYDSVNGVWIDDYGKNEQSFASSGPFILTSPIHQTIDLQKNPTYPLAHLISHTHYRISIMSQTDQRIAFDAGQLDFFLLNNDTYPLYRTDPSIRRLDGLTIFRIGINSMNEQQYHDYVNDNMLSPGWVLKPILQIPEFRQALYHAIDRQSLLSSFVLPYGPAMEYLSRRYYSNPEIGEIYRDTVQGIDVLSHLYPSTYGYNLNLAIALYKQAIDALIQKGELVPGQATTISLEYATFSTQVHLDLGYALKAMLETTFNQIPGYDYITFELVVAGYPGMDLYYAKQMVGRFDLALSGISGSTLDPWSYLDVFCSDDRSGLFLLWGLDTAIPAVTWNNLLWSYDALVSSLLGETVVVDGMESNLPVDVTKYVMIHYQNWSQDYSGVGVWAWRDNVWGQEFFPTLYDGFGAVIQVPVSLLVSGPLGLIPFDTQGTNDSWFLWKDNYQGLDLSLNIDALLSGQVNELHFYFIAGSDQLYPSEQAALDSILRVGTSQLPNQFLPGANSIAINIDAMNLLHGYPLFDFSEFGEYQMNSTVVHGFQVTEQQNGDLTFQFKLNPNLVWSNGVSITSYDYVLSILMQASMEWKTNGGTTKGSSIVGFDAFHHALNTNQFYFEGIKIIDSLTFEITINHAVLPNVNLLSELNYVPFPFYSMSIMDNDFLISHTQGTKLDSQDLQMLFDFVFFDYRYNPEVTAGPYKLSNTYSTYGVVTFVKNDLFQGNIYGAVPSIDMIAMVQTPASLLYQSLSDGTIDYVSNTSNPTFVEDALNNSLLGVHEYLRNGMGHLVIANEFGPTTSEHVRIAIAYLLDRDFIINATGQFLRPLYSGFYSPSKWETVVSEPWLQANMTEYLFNITKANQALDAGGVWIFEADGTTPFDPTKAGPGLFYYRHNQNGDRLALSFLITQGSVYASAIDIVFQSSMASAGIEYSSTTGTSMDWFNFLYSRHLWDPSQQTIHMTLVVTNFGYGVNPFYSLWHSDSVAANSTMFRYSDPILDQIIEDWMTANIFNRQEQLDYWQQFQNRLDATMPVIPIYTNLLFDLYSNRVGGVETTQAWNWTKAIYGMYID